MSKRRCGSGGTRSTQRRSTSGAARRQRRHHRALLEQPVDRAAAQRLVHARRWRARRTRRRAAAGSRARSRTRRPGSKLRSQEVLQPLDDALGLRIARLAEVPADLQLRRRTPANSSVGRPPWACSPDWRSQTSVSRQRPQRPQTAADPEQQIRRLLGEDQRAGAGARVAQARDHDPALAGLAVPDRDLAARLPEIELADLARPIDRALKRPRRRREQRPHLAQVVIDDRLAAIEAQRRDQLPDPLTRQRRIAVEQPMDLVLERIELRRPPPRAR